MECKSLTNLVDLYNYFVSNDIAGMDHTNGYKYYFSKKLGWPNAVLIEQEEFVNQEILSEISQLLGNSRSQTVILSPSISIDKHIRIIKASPFCISSFWISMQLNILHIEKPIQRVSYQNEAIEVSRVVTDSELFDCIRVLNKTLFIQNELQPENIGIQCFGDDVIWLKGVCNNSTVATLMIYFSITNSVSGIYNVCTLPEYRMKGIAKTMLLKAFEFITEREYNTAVLQSTDLGKKLYKGLGFTVDGYYGLLKKGSDSEKR